MSLSLHLQEAHYCRLHSQSNVYGLTNITLPCGSHKLLVASLRGKVVSMEFSEKNPLSKEVHFTYIPGDAEIISIDAFNKCHYGNGVVVGIAFIKASDDKPCQFLNIYSEWEPGSEFNLESIAQGCQNLELSFLPYQLYHADLVYMGSQETVFLLSGSDQKMHLYREDRYLHTFSEEPIAEFFPELHELTSCAMWIDCRNYNDYRRRVTAVGFQNGMLQVSTVDTVVREVLTTHVLHFDGPVTSLKLFTLHTETPCPAFVNQVLEMGNEDGLDDVDDHPELHLVVATAIEPAIVYSNILEKGLSEFMLLKDSDIYDSGLCVAVADIDLDGKNEILIGTYGQELLMYKHIEKKPPSEQSRPNSEVNSVSPPVGVDLDQARSSPSTDILEASQDETANDSPEQTQGSFQLSWQRSFADPVLSVDVLDITGDGVEEIIIVSLKGLHVLQHDLPELAELCIQRLQHATKQRPQEDVFQQLLQENLS